MSVTIATIAGTTGMGSTRQIIYAINSGNFWAFAWTGTQTLSTWYSPDGSSWTAGATTNAFPAHHSAGRSLCVGYIEIGSVDVVYILQADNSPTTMSGHSSSVLRATISGTTITFHTTVTTLVSGQNDAFALGYNSGSVEFDSNHKPFLSNSTLNFYDPGAARGGSVDSGSAEQTTPVSWTIDSVDGGIANTSRSAYLVNLGSGNIGLLTDDGNFTTTCTGVDWYTWNGSAWSGSASNDSATGLIASIDQNDWGAVKLSNTDVHLVYRNSTGVLIHRRYNGSSWVDGQTIPPQNCVGGAGIALTTDGQSVFLCIIDTDVSNTIRYIKWESAAQNGLLDTWLTWKALETSVQVRNWIGVVPSLFNGAGIVYWTEGSSFVSTTFSPPPDPQSWAFVQAKEGFFNASTGTVQFDNNVGLGNRIIVMVGCSDNISSTLTSVSDTGSNVYNSDVSFTGSNNSYVRSAPITGGAGTRITVTVNISVTDNYMVWIAEYSGVSTAANAVDVSGTTDGTVASTSHSATTSGITTSPNELVLFFNHDDGSGGSQTGAGGLTLRGSDSANAFTSSFGDKNGTGGATQTGNVTTGSSISYTCVVVVYKVIPLGTTTMSINPGTIWRRSYWRGVLHPQPANLLPASGGPVSNVVTATDNLSSLSDTPTRIDSLPRTSSDTLNALSDTATELLSLPRLIVDNLSALSDTATRGAQTFTRTVTDNLSALSDTATRIVSMTRSISDNLSALSDTATRSAQSLSRTATDNLSALSDTATRTTQSFIRTATDTLGALSETATRILGLPRTATDNLSAMSDTANMGRLFARTATDTLSAITDTATRATQSFTRTATDNLSALSDTATRAAQSFIRTTTDTLGALTESATAIKVILRSATDTLSAMSDTATRATQSFSRTATDNLAALLEAANRVSSFTRAVVDNLSSISDTASAIKTIIRSATDTLGSISDAATRTLNLARTSSDNLASISDIASRAAIRFTRTAVDSLAALVDNAFNNSAVPLFFATARWFARDGSLISKVRDGSLKIFGRDASSKNNTRG